MSEEASKGFPLTVAIAEDSGLLRAGIVRLITDAGHRVVAEASDGPGFLSAIEEQTPDVAVVDIFMPGQGGLQTIGRLRQEWPAVKIVADGDQPGRVQAGEGIASPQCERFLQQCQSLDLVMCGAGLLREV